MNKRVESSRQKNSVWEFAQKGGTPSPSVYCNHGFRGNGAQSTYAPQ